MTQEPLEVKIPLSTNSRHVVVEDSDHFIHWSAPDEVIEAVRGVISYTREEVSHQGHSDGREIDATGRGF